MLESDLVQLDRDPLTAATSTGEIEQSVERCGQPVGLDEGVVGVGTNRFVLVGGQQLQLQRNAGQPGPQLVSRVAGETSFRAERLVESTGAHRQGRADVVDLTDSRRRRERGTEVAGSETTGRRSELLQWSGQSCPEDRGEHGCEEHATSGEHPEEDELPGESLAEVAAARAEFDLGPVGPTGDGVEAVLDRRSERRDHRSRAVPDLDVIAVGDHPCDACRVRKSALAETGECRTDRRGLRSQTAAQLVLRGPFDQQHHGRRKDHHHQRGDEHGAAHEAPTHGSACFVAESDAAHGDDPLGRIVGVAQLSAQ